MTGLHQSGRSGGLDERLEPRCAGRPPAP